MTNTSLNIIDKLDEFINTRNNIVNYFQDYLKNKDIDLTERWNLFQLYAQSIFIVVARTRSDSYLALSQNSILQSLLERFCFNNHMNMYIDFTVLLEEYMEENLLDENNSEIVAAKEYILSLGIAGEEIYT